MAVDVRNRTIILDLTHIIVRHRVAETGVLREHDLLSLWRVDDSLRDGVGGNF